MKKTVLTAAFILGSLAVTGCANTTLVESYESTAGTTLVIETSAPSETSETTEATETTAASNPEDSALDDRSPYISKSAFGDADKVQGQGYIPLKLEEVLDPEIRKCVTELYNKGYTLCDLNYLGNALAGCALIDRQGEKGDFLYFNTGVNCEKDLSDPNAEGLGDEYYFIKMTENQYENLMLRSSSVNYYIYGGDYYPVEKDFKIPEEEDDGNVRRLSNENGCYIEYHRDTSICVLYVDHDKVEGNIPIANDLQGDKK